MFAITYAAAILTTAFAVVAAVTFLYKRSPLHLTLATYLTAATVWIGGNVIADVSYTPAWLYAACAAAFIGAMAKIFIQFILTDLLIDGRFPSWRRFLLYGIPCFGLALFAASPYAIQDIAFPVGRPAEIVPGVLYSFALYLSLASIAYSTARLIWGVVRETDFTRRMQFAYVLTGLLLASVGGLFFTLLLPLLGEYRFYSLGPICTLFFVAGCAYAISRHRLFDIRIAIRCGVTYSLLVVFVIALYLFLLASVNLLITGPSEANMLFSAGLATVIGAFSIPLIERSFRRATDRFFFKEKYDYPDAMQRVSEILSTATTFEEVVQHVERGLGDIFRATRVCVTLSPETEHSSDHSDELRDELAIPIYVEHERIGVIKLGPKLSGDPYSSEDIQLLTTITFQLTNSLARVRLYQEVERHAHALEQKVMERTRQLSESHERERQVLNDISHNLQTPLTVLQTKLERLKPHLTEDADVRAFEQSLSGFSDFIYDLLAFARLDSESGSRTSKVSMSDLVEDLAEETTIVAESSGIRMETHVTPSLYVRGDERRLREALMNVLGNAIKYMRTDGPRTIALSLTSDTERAIITVTDTGLGIASDDLPHIFDRFYRSKNVSTSLKGTGLGLSIVKRIMEQHGGSIAVESDSGAGTTVRISIPRLA